MSEKICNYYNTGYYKHTKTKEECRLKHPTEVCKNKICKEKSCVKRYHKECKYMQKCRNEERCHYRHSVVKSSSKFKASKVFKN